MKQAIYGLILLVFLALPPVRELAESIMSIHMHMQMPLIAVSGFLLTPLLQKSFPKFFQKWNENGLPGFVLVMVVILYWMIPKAMDDALASGFVEFMKFLSWWLMGVALRDSWLKANHMMKNILVFTIAVVYFIMAGVYIFVDAQLCNNYLLVDQRTLGWGFLMIALCIVLYFVQALFINPEDYEETSET